MADYIEVVEETTVIEVDETHVDVVTIGTQGPPGASPDSVVQRGPVESADLVLGEHSANTLAPEDGAGYEGGGGFLSIKGGQGNTGDQFGGALNLQGGDGIGSGNAGSVSIYGGQAQEDGIGGNVSIAAGSNSEGERGFVYIQDLVEPLNPGDAVNLRTLDAHVDDVNNPHGVTKQQVGLGNVNNTSDASKPVSTAQLAAINARLAITGGVLTGSLDIEGGHLFANGAYDEASDEAGVYLGGPIGFGTPRALFANGNPAENWQIDNNYGVFRWFTPGKNQMQLSDTTLDLNNKQVKYVNDPTDAKDAVNLQYLQAAIAALVESAPGTLDTLNELAAALGDDPNFATTIMNALALKANASDVGRRMVKSTPSENVPGLSTSNIDYYYSFTSAAVFTLPSSGLSSHTVKNRSAGIVTVAGIVDGDTSGAEIYPGESMTFIHNGTDWDAS